MEDEMGKEPAKCGGEMDATSAVCRRLYARRAGVWRYWKNKINRRVRRKARRELGAI